MRKEDWQRTNEAVISAAQAVLAECRAPLSYVGRVQYAPNGWTKVAVIGFAGDSLRGMFGLHIEPRLLQRTLPIAATSQDDWQCELANLVLGRFKRELLRLGITVHLSTPMLVEGTDVSLDTTAVSALVHMFTSEQDGSMQLVFDAVAESSTHVAESTTTTTPVASGDVVIF